jgi:hypothetical protein
VRPLGSVSVSAIPLSATEPAAVFGIVIVRTDVPPAGMVAGAKAFASVMLFSVIARFAVAGAEFETPCVVVSALAAIVLVYDAAVAPVTLTVIVQVPFAFNVPADNATLAEPAAAATVPPSQVVAALGVEAIVRPLGSVSVSAMPLSATEPAAVFGIVMVSVEIPPAGMVAGAKAFASVMVLRLTVRFAVADAGFVTPCVVVSALIGIVFV